MKFLVRITPPLLFALASHAAPSATYTSAAQAEVQRYDRATFHASVKLPGTVAGAEDENDKSELQRRMAAGGLACEQNLLQALNALKTGDEKQAFAQGNLYRERELAFQDCVKSVNLDGRGYAKIGGREIDLQKFTEEYIYAIKDLDRAIRIANGENPPPVPKVSSTPPPDTNLAQAQQPKTQEDLLMAEIGRIGELLSQKKITKTEAGKEMSIAARAYLPNDRLAHAYFDSIASYLERVDKKEITAEQAEELTRLRTERFNAAIQQRAQLAGEQEKQAAQRRENELSAQRDAQYRSQLDQQQALQEAQRRQAIGNFFSTFGRSMQQAYPPTTTCRTVPGVGGQFTTVCQ